MRLEVAPFARRRCASGRRTRRPRRARAASRAARGRPRGRTRSKPPPSSSLSARPTSVATERARVAAAAVAEHEHEVGRRRDEAAEVRRLAPRRGDSAQASSSERAEPPPPRSSWSMTSTLMFRSVCARDRPGRVERDVRRQRGKDAQPLDRVFWAMCSCAVSGTAETGRSSRKALPEAVRSATSRCSWHELRAQLGAGRRAGASSRRRRRSTAGAVPPSSRTRALCCEQRADVPRVGGAAHAARAGAPRRSARRASAASRRPRRRSRGSCERPVDQIESAALAAETSANVSEDRDDRPPRARGERAQGACAPRRHFTTTTVCMPPM